MALASARGVNLEACSRGGEPDWTAEDVALASSGLGPIEFSAAMFSLAGDDSQWTRLRTYLLEYLLYERERMQWARKVETVDGKRIRFAEPLVELWLLEERCPAKFQVSPHLRAIALRVEAEEWRKTVSHQWMAVASEYRRRLLDAEEHIRRKLRGGY
jgi:hypothetical protein